MRWRSLEGYGLHMGWSNNPSHEWRPCPMCRAPVLVVFPTEDCGGDSAIRSHLMPDTALECPDSGVPWRSVA